MPRKLNGPVQRTEETVLWECMLVVAVLTAELFWVAFW